MLGRAVTGAKLHTTDTKINYVFHLEGNHFRKQRLSIQPPDILCTQDHPPLVSLGLQRFKNRAMLSVSLFQAPENT